MLLKVKRGRIWLSNNEIYKNKFIEVFIKNRDKRSSFFAVISKDKRVYIPKKIREKLFIVGWVELEKIKIIKNKKRGKRLIKNKKIDILSAIPKKTLSNYDILVNSKGNKLCCWYCTYGRPNEILLNKNVPLKHSNIYLNLGKLA